MGISLFDSTFFIWLAFLGIAIPVFTLGVSLMSHVIDRSKQEIERYRLKTETKLTEEIHALEKEIEAARQEDDARKLKAVEGMLEKVMQSRRKFEKETAIAIKSYDILNFKDSVIVPGFYFLFAIFFSLLITMCVLPWSIILCSAMALFFILMGIFRVSKCLNVIRGARLTFDKFERERMAESFSRIFREENKKHSSGK
jgi:hypothetical protein